MADQISPGARAWPRRPRVGGWVSRFPAVVSTKSRRSCLPGG